ncbi:golgin subfamily B member 1-like [Stylophora pistillata]|uniref:golgin subfamily B member 1-like n=1 Tax=Stylophora pistillata TaxID=50429 RepID=UPI000C056B68|nr:golgin subfamily B member 1-like [Stylophora pistillata]
MAHKFMIEAVENKMSKHLQNELRIRSQACIVLIHSVENLELRIKELIEQNMRLRDKVVEEQETGKRYQEELLRSQKRCTEIESWYNGNQDSIVKKLQEEKEELDKEVQHLKRDLSSLNIPNGNQDADILELGMELSRTKQELEVCKESMIVLQEEKESLKYDLHVVSNKIAAIQVKTEFEEMRRNEHENSSILHDLDAIRDQLQMYRENCTGLENEVKIYKEKLDICNEELAATKNEFVEFKEINNVEKNEMAKIEKSLSDSKMKLGNSEGDLKDLKAENLYSKLRIQELEEKICRLAKQKDESGLDLHKTDNLKVESKPTPKEIDFDQHIQDLEAGISLISRKLSESETELCRSQSQVEELSLQLKESLNKIAELESRPGNEAKEGNADANSLLQQAKRQTTAIRFTLQRKEKENRDLEMKLKETREEMHIMEIHANVCEAERFQLRENFEKEKEQRSYLHDEYQALQQGITEQRKREGERKKELEKKNAIIAELKAMAAGMELKYHELCEKHTAIQELQERFEKENQEIEDDLLQTQRDMADMQVNFKLSENEKEHLIRQFQTAKETIADLQSKFELADQGFKEKQHELTLTKQRLARMEEELEEASKSKSELEFQLYESSANAIRKGEEDINLENQLEDLHRENEGLRHQISGEELFVEGLKDKICSLETDLATLRTDMSYTESLLDTKEEELKRLTLKLKSSEEEIRRLADMCENTIQEKGNLEIDLSVARKKIETLESFIKEKEYKESSLVRTLQENRSKFVYKETDIASYRSKIASLELQNETLYKEKEELCSKVEELQDKASMMKQQLEEVLISRDQTIRRRMELEEKVIEIQQDLDESAKTKAQREEELQDLRSKIVKYEVQIESLKRQNEELQEKIVETNIQVVNQREELMKLEITATEHEKLLACAKSNLEQKTKEHEHCEGVMKGLQADLNKVKNELITSKISHQFALDENSRLSRKIQEQETKLGLFEQDVSDVNEENKRVNIDLGSQTAKANSLHIQLGSTAREKERLKEDLRVAKSKVHKLQEDLMLANNKVREKERIAESYRVEMCEKDSHIEQLKHLKDSLGEKVLALRKELQTTAFYHESSESKLKTTRDEISSLKLKLSQYEATVDTLLKERDHKDKEYEDCSQQQHFHLLLKKSEEQQAILEKQIENNKAKVTKLEQDLKISRQDCLDSQFENSKSQRLLEDLKVANNLCDKERRNLREEVLEVNRTLSDLELKYENEQRDNLALQAQLQEANSRSALNRNEILKLSKQCVEQKIQLDSLTKEKEQKNSHIEEMKSTKAHLEEKSMELRGNLTSALGECEKLRGGHQQLQDEIITQQKIISNLKDRLQKTSKAEQIAHEELKVKTAEMESLNQELVEVSNENNDLKIKVKRLENNLVKQREDLSMAENQIAETQKVLSEYKTEIGGKITALTTLKTENGELKEELYLANDSLKRMKVEMQAIQENQVVIEQSSVLQSGLYKDESENDNSELNRLNESLSEAEVNLQKSIEREHTLQDQIANLEITHSQFKESIQALTERERILMRRNEELLDEVGIVNTEMAKSREEAKQALNSLEITQEKLAQLEAQNGRLEASRSLLTKELKEERGKVGKAEDELLEAHCKLQELQAKWDYSAKATEGNETVLDTVMSEKKDLEKDTQTLRDELSSAHALMNATLKKNRELDHDNFLLKKAIAEFETRKEGIEEEQRELSKILAQHQKIIKELQHQVQQKQKEIATLREELENEHLKVAEAREEYDNVLKNLSQFKGGVKDYEKAMSEKDAQVLLLENLKNNLESELKREVLKSKETQERLKEEEEKLKRIIQENDNLISEFKLSILKMKERNDKLQADVADLKQSASEKDTQLHNAQKEAKRLNSEFLSQGSVIAALQTKNNVTTEENQSLKDELNKLKSNSSEQQIQVEALRHENERLQKKLNEIQVPKSPLLKRLQTPKNTMEPDLVSLKRLIELENAYQNLSLEKENIQSNNTSLEERILQLDEEINSYIASKDSLEKEMVWKDKRITELEQLSRKAEHSAQLNRNELQTVSMTMNEMERELNSAQNALNGLEECNATYEETIKHLEGQLIGLQQKNSQLEKSLENSQSKFNSQRNELMNALSRVSDLESAKKSKASSNDELLIDLQSCRNKVTSLEEELCASAREQVKANLTVRELKEKNAKLQNDLQQIQSQLREEKQDRAMNEKEIREKNEVMKKLQRENRELENEITEASKELNAKAAESLTMVNKQEETQEELDALGKQIRELESLLLREKGENEKLRLETSATRQLYSDLKAAYDNLLEEINSSQDQLEDKELKKSVELKKSSIEKDQLNKEIQLLNKRVSMFKENNEKIQREKRELEKKVKMMQQRLLILEADEKTVETIKALQTELEESKQKIYDLNAMYEAVRLERDNLRTENIKPTSSRGFARYQPKLREASACLESLTQHSKLHEQAAAKKDMLELQAKAMLLDEKLREARERLEGLKTLPPKSDKSMSESTESGSDETSEEDETQETGQRNGVVDGPSQEPDS